MTEEQENQAIEDEQVEDASGEADPDQEEALTPEQERDAFRDRYMRALADLENYRRRAVKERQELQRYAAERPVTELLPVFDNLQRALEAGSNNPEAVVEGVKMILNMAEQAFARLGVTMVGAAGEKFDPNLHDALSQIPDEEVPAGHIVSLFEHGYRLHDRLIRAAKVVVSTGPADGSGATAAGEEDAPAAENVDLQDEGTDPDDLLQQAAADLEDWEPGSADDEAE